MFFRQGVAVWPWLAWNSQSSCLSASGVLGLKSGRHHTWPSCFQIRSPLEFRLAQNSLCSPGTCCPALGSPSTPLGSQEAYLGGLSSIGGNSLLSRLEACSIEMEVPLQTRITVVSGSELGGLSEQGTSCEKGTVPVVLDL